MNIPEAKVAVRLMLEGPDVEKEKLTLYVIEGMTGYWVLLKKSKRTTAMPLFDDAVVACFGGEAAVKFGEFQAAEKSKTSKTLERFGLTWRRDIVVAG